MSIRILTQSLFPTQKKMHSQASIRTNALIIACGVEMLVVLKVTQTSGSCSLQIFSNKLELNFSSFMWKSFTQRNKNKNKR